MAVLVIGGSGSGAGKTAVGCALLGACPELRWVGVKATPHGYEAGEGLWEELDAGSEKDTGRYRKAGARRAFLLSGAEGAAAGVLEARRLALECDAVLVESNRIATESIARVGERRVCLAVLAGSATEWKASLVECLGRADAVVLAGGLRLEGPVAGFDAKPVFSLPRGEWAMPELVEFVRGCLLP